LAKGLPPESHAEVVEEIVRIAKELGRTFATPDEARKILHLPLQENLRNKITHARAKREG
jgi:uncharacterized protein (DUF849 family)